MIVNGSEHKGGPSSSEEVIDKLDVLPVGHRTVCVLYVITGVRAYHGLDEPLDGR